MAQNENGSTDDPMMGAYTVDEEGIEVFSLDAIVPAKRRVQIKGRVYDLDGEVPLPVLMSFVKFEEGALEGDTDVDKSIGELMEVESRVVEMLREHNENVPDTLGLGAQGIAVLIQHFLGGRTATAAVLGVIGGGDLAAAEARLAEAVRNAEEQGLIDPEDEQPHGAVVKLAPLASEKPSSKRSSRSPSATTGSRGGGKKRAGAHSSPSSRRRGKTT